MPENHLSSPSKVLRGLDLNLCADIASNNARTPTTPSTPSFSHGRALRPFPISLEEEESSESDRDLNRLTTSNGHVYDHLRRSIPTTPPASSPRERPQHRPRPVVHEEEESSDDPDAIPAELPVSHPLRPAQSPISAADHTHGDALPPRHDLSVSGLTKRPSPRRQSTSLSPSKVRRKSPQWTQRHRAAETSIISISSDSDSEGDDDGDGSLKGLLAPAAPLLIARSRTGVQKRSVPAPAITAAVEPEVIDLT
jgi:hypothetical protein